MPYKLGRSKWEPVKDEPNTYRVVVDVYPIDEKGKQGKSISISVEQNMLNSDAKALIKAKLRNEISSLDVKKKARTISEEVVEELKAEYPEEFK